MSVRRITSNIMRNRHTEEEILLDRTGVDYISEATRQWLNRCGVNKRDNLRVQFAMEDQLLNICEHFEEKAKCTFVTGKKFSVPYIAIRYEGESFNPAEDFELSQKLLANLGLTPQWSYQDGVNTLYLRAPHQTHKSEMFLIIAVVSAILIGLLKFVLPSEAIAAASAYALKPISDAFMNILNTFVRLMVFFSVITGICSTDSLKNFRTMGKTVIGRLLLRSVLGTGLGIVLIVLIPVFDFDTGAGAGALRVDDLVSLIFSAFPKNPFTPFIEGNMLQIVFMAVLIGGVLLVLGDKVAKINDAVEKLTLVFMQIIESVCKLLPIYIFVSLVTLIWDNGAGIIMNLWKPIVICLVLCLALMIGKIVFTALRFHISPFLLFSKIKKTVLIGLLTASSSAAVSEMITVNEKKLGVSERLDRFSLPFSNILCGSTCGISFVIILCYLADFHSVSVNLGWFVNLWILCTVMSMAAPPVSGGVLAVLGILMTQLGIPSAGLAVTALLGIITDFISTSTRIGIIHCEIVLQANKLNMLDRKMLTSKK